MSYPVCKWVRVKRASEVNTWQGQLDCYWSARLPHERHCHAHHAQPMLILRSSSSSSSPFFEFLLFTLLFFVFFVFFFFYLEPINQTADSITMTTMTQPQRNHNSNSLQKTAHTRKHKKICTGPMSQQHEPICKWGQYANEAAAVAVALLSVVNKRLTRRWRWLSSTESKPVSGADFATREAVPLAASQPQLPVAALAPPPSPLPPVCSPAPSCQLIMQMKL